MTSLAREHGAEQDLDAFAATLHGEAGRRVLTDGRRGGGHGRRSWTARVRRRPPSSDRSAQPLARNSASARPSSVTGSSSYIHSRAIRCQLASASSWPSTARVSSSRRRPNRCSGAMSWWRARGEVGGAHVGRLDEGAVDAAPGRVRSARRSCTTRSPRGRTRAARRRRAGPARGRNPSLAHQPVELLRVALGGRPLAGELERGDRLGDRLEQAEVEERDPAVGEPDHVARVRVAARTPRWRYIEPK